MRVSKGAFFIFGLMITCLLPQSTQANPVMSFFSEAYQVPESTHGLLTIGVLGWGGNITPAAVVLDGEQLPNPIIEGGYEYREGGSGEEGYHTYQVCLCALAPGQHTYKWIDEDGEELGWSDSLTITDPPPSGGSHGSLCIEWCTNWLAAESDGDEEEVELEIEFDLEMDESELDEESICRVEDDSEVEETETGDDDDEGCHSANTPCWWLVLLTVGVLLRSRMNRNVIS